MKRKKILLIILVIAFGLLTFFIIYKFYMNNQKKRRQERYSLIKENTEKAVEWEIKAVYPKCSLSKIFKETNKPTSFSNSSYLISQGYLKKSDLLDIDNKSYCDVYVVTAPHFENPQENQNNCEISYKIYLKCKDYEDKGYKSWH